ncbi:MAG: hypothetical protein KHY88_06785 [Erysipelotrichaceae bacterium]|nr:hypothetical protein [Erysipelotrichaceae bacterium]
MSKFYDWLIGEQKNQTASNFFWNMTGSMSLALGTMMLTILVNRIVGDYAGGDFAMALATSQLMSTIGYFETRTYQVTDTKKVFSFSDYYTTRLITDLLMIVCSVVYIFFKGYSFEKSILVMMLCVYKMLDTFADVFEGEFQQNDRLDVSGKSMTIRTVFSIIALVVILFITKNIYFSMIIAIIVALICVYFTNIRIITNFSEYSLNLNFLVIKKIISECVPLFASVFMSTYVLNASRYAIEANLPSNFHSKYTAIFLPVSTINLLIGFIFKPMLTTMAKKWNDGYHKEFMKTISIVLLGVCLVTLCAILGAYFLGIPVLSFLYNTDLNRFKSALLILLIGGGLNAANVILYYALSVMRKQKVIMLTYIITFISSLIIPNFLTKMYSINGAAWSFVIVMFILFIQSLFFVLLSSFKSNKNY